MNQVSFNGIQENFYAAKSAMGSFLGKRVSIIKENPNVVVAAIIVLAAIAIVGATVKCYRAYNNMKNEVSNLKNKNEALESQKNWGKKLVDYLNVEYGKTEGSFNQASKDVAKLTTDLEVQSKKNQDQADEIKDLNGQLEELAGGLNKVFNEKKTAIDSEKKASTKAERADKNLKQAYTKIQELENEIIQLKKTPEQKMAEAKAKIKATNEVKTLQADSRNRK